MRRTCIFQLLNCSGLSKLHSVYKNPQYNWVLNLYLKIYQLTLNNDTSFLIYSTSAIIKIKIYSDLFFNVSLLIVFTLTFFYTNGYRTLTFYRHQHFNTETKQAKRSYRQEASIRRKHASIRCQATLARYILSIYHQLWRNSNQNGKKPQLLLCFHVSKFKSIVI